MARLELDRLAVSYGAVSVLPDLSLTVEDGECIALLGPSGCGKTTTLRAIAGFVAASSGRIRIGGRDMAGVPPHGRNIGLVFQDYALFPHMSVAENVAYGLKRRGCPKAETAARVAEALRTVRLERFADRYPGAMSGGQRQRVALARAIVVRPDVLLLDEPLGALDRKLRDEMQYELKTLQEQLGYTCIIVTHDQEEALSLAGRVALMFDGDIAEIGPPARLYERPSTVRAMDFLGASSFLPALVKRQGGAVYYNVAGCCDLSGPSVDLPDGTAVQIGIRPERVTVGTDRPAGLTGIPGTIQQIVFKGPSADIYLACRGGPLRAQIGTRGLRSVRALAPGQEVWADIDPEDLLVFPADQPAAKARLA